MRLSKLVFFTLAAPVGCLLAANVTTQHNDTLRTGANTTETILNRSNVSVNTFGKLFSRPVDGQVYAQPLYLPQVSIPGQGIHNLVYVATENNTVYAFDADNSSQSTPLWQVNLGPPVQTSNIPGASDDVQPVVGISSTPVIDIPTGTLYVVSSTAPSATTVQFKLHALNVATGAEKFRGPIAIQGSVAGSGAGSVNGSVAFDPTIHGQRAGLLLQNGSIYVSFASHGDYGNYHGWIFSFDQKSLKMTGIQNVTPNGQGAGVWQGSTGLAGDGVSVYAVTGNGDLNAATGNYGQSVVKMSQLGSLAITDYFAPEDWALTSAADQDLGSGGALLIPGTSLLLSAGKAGTLYVLNTQSLGQYVPANQVLQQWQLAGGTFGGLAYYNSTLYAWPRGSVLSAYQFNGASSNPIFNTTPLTSTLGPINFGYTDVPAMSISANGTTAGTAILWAAYSPSGVATGFSTPGILQAFDATDLTLLWSSDQASSSRDAPGGWSKWCPPTVANGKVYLATMDGALNVYGLLPAN